MEFSDLNVFLTVAREKSFSRAAAKLYRTQPAVSIALRRLEERVGERLLERKARSVQLTDAGTLLVEYAERILNLRDAIHKGIRDLRDLRGGRLSIGVNESSIHALLPTLARYRRKYPQVQISIQRTFSRDIPREVLNYGVDFGVVSFIPQEEKLAAVRIFRDELAFVVPLRHRLARQRTVGITELGNEQFVAHIVESPFRWRVIRLFQKHRVPLRMPVELPTIESIKRFVQMGMGVAIVPRMCVRAELKQGLLKEVRIRQLHMPRDLYLVHRRDARLSHAAAMLYKMLRSGQEDPV
jgi:DNA-binding transcriptional LysR family regulator